MRHVRRIRHGNNHMPMPCSPVDEPGNAAGAASTSLPNKVQLQPRQLRNIQHGNGCG
jgi:hypothetical protein